MKGFKDFLMQGNLIELAVAVIIGASFGDVVKTFTNIIMSFIGVFGGQPDFSTFKPAGLPVGVFVNAIVTFVIIATVIYFLIIKPFEAMREITKKRTQAQAEEEAAAPTTDELLVEIRDLLKSQAQRQL